jgi:hypothetical protein
MATIKVDLLIAGRSKRRLGARGRDLLDGALTTHDAGRGVLFFSIFFCGKVHFFYYQPGS